MKKQYLFLLVILISGISINAQVTLPKIFADNMVLQRNSPIPVWGWAAANEKIEVRFHNQIKKTRADKNGKWIIHLDSESAGGPYILTMNGNNTIEIKNVLVGEVWLCSGQSNMEFRVSEVINAEKEINDANFPMIRHFDVANAISSLPEDDFKEGKWEACSQSTVGNFTAVGYFFAKKIYEELKIPIGLINASWGGTDSETWTSREAFENSDEFKEMIAEMPKAGLDSISNSFIKSEEKRIEALQKSKIDLAQAKHYNELTFDDSHWPELEEPQEWENQELGAIDGVVWLRKTIQVTANDAGKEALIELVRIFDEDITFVNGIEIGRELKWNATRKYVIPTGILKKGDNVIAIRIVDNGGSGGISGEKEEFKITTSNTVIPLSGKWKYQVESVFSNIGKNSYPTLLFNGMINPIIPYAFRGVLWYQGESNAWRAYQYRTAFPLLINDWRKKWDKEFPFYFVQLSSYDILKGNSNNGSMWAELREAQTLTLSLPNTGMAVTTDIGNPNDVHPTNKQDVGKRLAAIALKNVYDKDIVCRGPTFKSMEIHGNQIIATFENTGSGLSTPDKYGYVKGFEIAGSDQVFYYAKAQIVNNKVVIYNENVPNPVAIHFGWADDASDNNLYNKEGFPAGPFRTDDWKSIMKESKYKISK